VTNALGERRPEEIERTRSQKRGESLLKKKKRKRKKNLKRKGHKISNPLKGRKRLKKSSKKTTNGVGEKGGHN